jgi:hypothetical protein
MEESVYIYVFVIIYLFSPDDDRMRWIHVVKKNNCNISLHACEMVAIIYTPGSVSI